MLSWFSVQYYFFKRLNVPQVYTIYDLINRNFHDIT